MEHTLTSVQIESIGWKHYGTARNGGSKIFSFDKRFTLEFHGDNFYKVQNQSADLNNIEIQEISINWDYDKIDQSKHHHSYQEITDFLHLC